MKKIIFLFTILFVLGIPGFAQPPDGDCDPDICGDTDEEVPLDSVCYLLPAGVILGIVGVFIQNRKAPEARS